MKSLRLATALGLSMVALSVSAASAQQQYITCSVNTVDDGNAPQGTPFTIYWTQWEPVGNDYRSRLDEAHERVYAYLEQRYGASTANRRIRSNLACWERGGMDGRINSLDAAIAARSAQGGVQRNVKMDFRIFDYAAQPATAAGGGTRPAASSAAGAQRQNDASFREKSAEQLTDEVLGSIGHIVAEREKDEKRKQEQKRRARDEQIRNLVQNQVQRVHAGDVDAYATMGANYLHGTGIAQDYAEALRLSRLAAEQGHPRGLAVLGTMYMTGLGVDQNIAEGLHLLHKAADSGDLAALETIAALYHHGHIRVGDAYPVLHAMAGFKNRNKAICWRGKAAARGGANTEWHMKQLRANPKKALEKCEQTPTALQRRDVGKSVPARTTTTRETSPPAPATMRKQPRPAPAMGRVGLQLSPGTEFRVTGVVPSSPAARARVKPGYVILQVNGEDVTGWSREQLGARLRGFPGTDVAVHFGRAGEPPVTLKFIRGTVRAAESF